MAVDMCMDSWSQHSFGVAIDGLGCVNHLLWADNLYLVGTCRSQMVRMFSDLTHVLADLGLEWKLSSLKFMHTCKSDHAGDILTPGPLGLRVFLVDSMEILGACVSSTGDTLLSAQHRLNKAAGAFWQHQGYFLSKGTPLKQRLH